MVTLTNAMAMEAMTGARKACAKFAHSLKKHSADDIVQDTLVKVCEGFDPERGTIGAMAYRMAYNEALDYLRGRGYTGNRKDTDSLTIVQDSDDGSSETQADIADATPSALGMMIRNERIADVTKAIETLTPAMRDAIATDLDDEVSKDGATRIAKMRAIDAIQESVRHPGYATRKVAKRAKVAKVEIEETKEDQQVAPQRGLSCLTIWRYVMETMKVPADITLIAKAQSVDDGWAMSA